jgi:hypothetical protein
MELPKEVLSVQRFSFDLNFLEYDKSSNKYVKIGNESFTGDLEDLKVLQTLIVNLKLNRMLKCSPVLANPIENQVRLSPVPVPVIGPPSLLVRLPTSTNRPKQSVPSPNEYYETIKNIKENFESMMEQATTTEKIDKLLTNLTNADESSIALIPMKLLSQETRNVYKEELKRKKEILLKMGSKKPRLEPPEKSPSGSSQK